MLTLRMMNKRQNKSKPKKVKLRSGEVYHLVPDAPLFAERKHYSSEHHIWRRQMIEQIRLSPALFSQGTHKDIASIRDLLDESVSHLWLVARILSLFPGNQPKDSTTEPIDELIRAVLARGTRKTVCQQAYAALKKNITTWDVLLTADRYKVEQLLFPSRLTKKATDIINILSSLKQQFGSCTLDPVQDWPDEDVETFLCSLPKVDRNIAYQVMLHALKRSVFPATAGIARVLERLGLYHNLGLSLRDLHPKLKQTFLTTAIPPALRYSLHKNLEEFSHNICKATKPECTNCPINNFCAYFRSKTSSELTASRKPTLVDLFCGAGGLSAGFRQAGFRTILAIDEDQAAIKTFLLNHPEVPDDRVICADLRKLQKSRFTRIKKLLQSETVDVLVGGPPCQGFSRVGWRAHGTGHRYEATEDDRNHLYREFISLLRLLKPKVVLMENVPGIGEVRFNDGTSFQDLACKAMGSLGYQTTLWTLNAAWYGVPQQRIRRVIVGSRLAAPPSRPEPEYKTVGDHSELSAAEPAITLMEAIGDLPRRSVDDGLWATLHTPLPAERRSSRYLQRYPILHPQGLLFSHVTRFQNKMDLERFRTLKPGEKYTDLIAKRPDLENYRTDIFDDKYYRLRSDAPCRTIVAHLRRDGNGYIHPLQCRSLSVREAARIQSFPDTFIFTGCRGNQFEQIGNAVPPLMAEAMARVILRHLVQHGARSLASTSISSIQQSGTIAKATLTLIEKQNR